MKSKGVHPYDYMDSFSKFSDTVLPLREDFYSLLRVILCKIRVILKGRGHGTSPIWLKFCMQSCFGVLTTRRMF